MSRTRYYLPALLVLVGAASLQAEVAESRVERSRIVSDQAPSRMASASTAAALGPEEAAPSSPGDADLGDQFILKQREKSTPFTFYGNVSGNYTNNVALQSNGGKGDNFLLGEMGVGWTHAFSPNFGLDLGVRQQFFRYDRYTALDFDGLNVVAGAHYALPQLGGIVLFAGYAFDRLVDMSQEEFYVNHSLSVGAQKTWALSRAHSLFVAYNSDFSVASDPDNQGRNYHCLTGGYNVDLTRRLSGQFTYKLTLVDYKSIDRLDVNNLVAIGFGFKITPWCVVSAMGSYIFNSSNRSEFEYQVGNVAVNLGLNARF